MMTFFLFLYLIRITRTHLNSVEHQIYSKKYLVQQLYRSQIRKKLVLSSRRRRALDPIKLACYAACIYDRG